MKLDKNHLTFFALLRAGLFPIHGEGVMVNDSLFESVDWEEVYRLAQEQSVQGVVLQGIEAVQGSWLKVHGSPLVPQLLLLEWIGEVQIMADQNKLMNEYVASLIETLRKNEIHPILVKGQGIAQCYEKPLCRNCGDIDLLLDSSDYEKAKALLLPQASSVEQEYSYFKHIGMTLDGWVVELHGTLQSRLSKRIDDELDRMQTEIHRDGEVIVWQNEGTDICLPSPDIDAIYVFTHILHHYFFEGIGLRQICDWCRLLWTYRDSLNYELLESRIRKMGIMTEWKAFAAFAAEYLGMPVEAIPLLDIRGKKEEVRWKKKADIICSFVLEVGNFGHKQRRDYCGQPYFVRKFNSFWGRLSDMLRHFTLFPKDSIVFFGGVLRSGLHAAVRGE